MGVFHLLHHEHQARYDKMFPYLWAYAGLLALAGILLALDGQEDILQGLRSEERRVGKECRL